MKISSQHKDCFGAVAGFDVTMRNDRNESGSAVLTEESGRSGAKGDTTTGLATTADAVDRKAVVAFGRLAASRKSSRKAALRALTAYVLQAYFFFAAFLPATAALNPAPAVKRGTVVAAIFISLPV